MWWLVPLLCLVAIFVLVGLAVKVLYPCGDRLEHVTRAENGKGNPCGCPLSKGL